MELQESYISLDKYGQIIKRRWLPAVCVFCSVFVIVQLAINLKRPIYVAEGKLRFQRINTTSSLTGVGTELGKLEPLAQNNPVNTEAEVIQSIPVLQKVIDRLELKNKKGAPLKPKTLLDQIKVKDIKQADVLEISYQNTNPELATKVVNTLMQVYLEKNVSSLRTEAAAARKFIEKQLPNAELVVQKAEAELANFKEKYKVVSLQEEATEAVKVIADLEKQISEAQSKLADAESQSQGIRKQLEMNTQQAVMTTAISQTSGVQEILKEIQQLESQLAARRTVLQDDHPQIIDLKDKLSSLNNLMQKRIQQVTGTNQPPANKNLQLGQLQQQQSARLAELEANRLGLGSQAATLFKLQAAYKERLNNLPRLEQQQRQLERKVQAAQSTYLLLLQKLQESRIAENQNVGNASIISEAEVPEEPVFSPIISYLSAGLIASLLALAVVFVLESRDRSIKTVDEAKELLQFTLLGIIPNFKKSRKLLVHNEEIDLYSRALVVRDTPRSLISEAYRMLRANLRFMSADKELKVIVVTSSVPQEGKSTVAANLAIAIAQMETKVLLIDADLHRPVQHKIWELNNSQGLSNLIVDQAETNITINQVVDNLDVLTSGVVPPSPASLLDSKRMANLIDTFAANYNFVIIDAPSLNVAADAATLGQMADGVLLVVRPGVVDFGSAAFAKEFLEKSGQNVLGQVINAVITQNERYSYYSAQEDYPPVSHNQAQVRH